MKQFNQSIILVLFSVISTSLYSQKFSFDISSGYSHELSPLFDRNYSSSYDAVSGTNSSTAKLVKSGFYDGFYLRLNTNYNVAENLFVSGGFLYQKSSEQAMYSSRYSSTSFNYSSNDVYNGTCSASNFYFMPALNFRATLSDKLGVEIGAGPLIQFSGTSNIFYESTETTTTSSGTDYISSVTEFEYKQAFEIGAFADLKLNFKASEKLTLFFNTNFRSLSFKPKSALITKYTENGIDMLPSLTVSDKEAIFHSSYSGNSSSQNPNEPYNGTRFSFASNTISFGLGLRYTITKNAEAATEELATEPASRFFVQAGGGFGLKISTYSNEQHDDKNDTYTNTYKPYSFGSGIQYGLVAGFRLKNNFSSEFGFILNNGKYEYENNSTNDNGSYFYSSTEKYKYKSSSMRLLVGFRAETNGEKINLYGRAGLLYALSSNVTENVTSTSTSNYSGSFVTNSSETEFEYSGGKSLGMYGGLGLSYKLNSTIEIFGEFIAYMNTNTPETRTMTKSINNGTDQLSTLTVSQKETVYVDEYQTGTGAPLTSEPSKQLKIQQPFSSAVLSVGIKFNLGN